MNSPAARLLPWHRDDLRRFLITLGLAAGAVVIAWRGTEQSSRINGQVTWLIVAVVGVTYATLRCAMFLAAAYSALTVRRREVLGPLALAAVEDSTPEPSASDDLVALPTMAYYHRTDCPFVQGKPAAALAPADHVAHGRRPCPGCQP